MPETSSLTKRTTPSRRGSGTRLAAAAVPVPDTKLREEPVAQDGYRSGGRRKRTRTAATPVVPTADSPFQTSVAAPPARPSFADWRQNRRFAQVVRAGGELHGEAAATALCALRNRRWVIGSVAWISPDQRVHLVVQDSRFRSGRILVQEGVPFMTESNWGRLHSEVYKLAQAGFEGTLVTGDQLPRIVLGWPVKEAIDFWPEVEDPADLADPDGGGENVIVLDLKQVLEGGGREALLRLLARRRAMVFGLLNPKEEPAVIERASKGDETARAQLFLQAALTHAAFAQPNILEHSACRPSKEVREGALRAAQKESSVPGFSYDFPDVPDAAHAQADSTQNRNWFGWHWAINLFKR